MESKEQEVATHTYIAKLPPLQRHPVQKVVLGLARRI